ncbi:SDR family oxidoreductase [Amycolatopsis sp. NPDC049252]|uniref:SDR family oxidoreductase n=1 Tax=Amycolatopsis sp. NPDC049252 TaxID=3363933 RepID=UPI0037128027
MIALTGATGLVGRLLVAELKGREVRVVTRSPEDAGFPADVEVVEGDPQRPETLENALRGADALFLHSRRRRRRVRRRRAGAGPRCPPGGRARRGQCGRPARRTAVAVPRRPQQGGRRRGRHERLGVGQPAAQLVRTERPHRVGWADPGR